MATPEPRGRIRPADVFGLRPLGPALRQCITAIAGDGLAPPAKWGPSSLRILRPWVSIPTWLGRTRSDGRVPIYNLFNRNPAPPGSAYSVRVTTCEDYRGGRLTYDGHVGTDFATPAGTPIVAAAAGRVRVVRNDMQRGGLKVTIDHGAGLMTTYNHLSRAHVRDGQAVARAEVIGISGMSGVDGVLFFPWLAPHLHFDVFLNGVPGDPFARPGEVSLWRSENDPRPHTGPASLDIPDTDWNDDDLWTLLASCRDPARRDAIQMIRNRDARWGRLVADSVFFSHSFVRHLSARRDAPDALCAVKTPHAPAPRLDLPFRSHDYIGAVCCDAL